jgi:hypothetical protein
VHALYSQAIFLSLTCFHCLLVIGNILIQYSYITKLTISYSLSGGQSLYALVTGNSEANQDIQEPNVTYVHGLDELPQSVI